MTWKAIWIALGGAVGWLVGQFEPAFPLIIVAILFILYDAWTAYQLDKRVKVAYPDRTARHEAKFYSFAFGKVVRKTIPERLVLILLAFLAEKYVFVHVTIPLSYIVTGVILFEQMWSALENNASCRNDERETRFWKTLQKIMVDKTERHFDVEVGDLEGEKVTEEQVKRMRKLIREFEKEKKRKKDENVAEG